MSDTNIDKAPVKVNEKSTLSQNIQKKLQASTQFNQNHSEWETTKKIAEAAGATIPVEPIASDEAISGQALFNSRNKSEDETTNIFSGKGDEKLNKDFNKIIKKISENPDEESRIMQAAGVIDGISQHLYSEKWEHTSAALDLAPESLQFCNLLGNFDPLSYSDYHGADLEKIKTDAGQNVLKHLSSESSPAYPEKKEEFRFLASEGMGMKAFDVLGATGSQGSLTPEQIIMAFGFDEKVTTGDIKAAGQKLQEYFRQNMGIDTRVNARTLSPEGFVTSTENMPILLSQIIKDKPEVADEIKGKLLGYCRSLAGKRPNIEHQSGIDYDRERKVNTYLDITQKINYSIASLYDPETVNIYDIIQKTAQNSFDKGFQTLIRDCNLQAHDNLGNTFEKHFKKYLKIKDDKDAKIRVEGEEIKRVEQEAAKNKLTQDKKDQEQLVQKYSESRDIQESFYQLYQSKQEDLPASLNNTLKHLDSLKTDHSELSAEIDFAKSVATQFNKLLSENSLTTQLDTEIDRRKKNIFSNKYTVNHQITFNLNQGKYDSMLKQVQEQIPNNPTTENYATLEALKLISKRSQSKRGYSSEE